MPGKILWVEDDPFLNSLVASKFAEHQYQITQAHDADETFAALERELPDIIVLDLLLPGMDGFGILEKLKADPRYRAIPVIVLSNLGQQSNIDRAKKLGAISYLIKADFYLDQIMDEIQKTIGAHH